jgi:hypothetical protein
MGISYEERSNRGGTPTGGEEIPAKAEKKVICCRDSFTKSINWATYIKFIFKILNLIELTFRIFA